MPLRRLALAEHLATRRPSRGKATPTAGSRAWPGSRAAGRGPRPRLGLAVEAAGAAGRPGHELAMAYSNLVVAPGRSPTTTEGALAWSDRAAALAEEIGWIGRSLVPRPEQRGYGRAWLLRQPRRCPEARAQPGDPRPCRRDGGARGPRVHATWLRARWRSATTTIADRHLEAGIRVLRRARPRRLWADYMLGWRARSELDQGRWDAAAADGDGRAGGARRSGADRGSPRSRSLGRVRARRGRSAIRWAPLDEALELARGTGELQRLAPVRRRPRGGRAGWRATSEVDRGRDRALALALEQSASLGRSASSASGAGARGSSTRSSATPSPSRSASSWPATDAGGRCAVGRDRAARTRRRSRLGHADDDAAQRARRSTSSSASAPSRRPRRVARQPARARRARRRRAARAPRRATTPAGLTARELEVARARRRGAAQRGDRGAAVRLREDGRPPRLGRSCASSASPRAARPPPRPPRLGHRRKIGSPPDVGTGARTYGCRVPRTTTASENLMTPERSTAWTCM